tara:strand:+ start:944 stop:1906 length:963 start_codon:yes stop_codon:yes gene_type:complete
LEAQTLRYYIKVFNIILIFSLFFFFLYFYYTLNKNIELTKNIIEIKKGENIENILSKNVKNLSKFEVYLTKLYYNTNLIFNKKFIHFGEFSIEKKISIIKLFAIISKPSNILRKLIIIEGSSLKDLTNNLFKNFNYFYKIPYEDIIADTYFYDKDTKYNSFLKHLVNVKKQYFKNNTNNELLGVYTEEEIMIIGSLIEKEGLDDLDKKKISSVIFNRLNSKMKLQIDATVIYAITDGNYNLNRKLLLKDLEVKHPFNTYYIDGLPPKPISYVGKKTLDLIFENYKSDFMFYFFNNSLNRHIFSKSFEEHKRKLNEYREKQ